MYLFEHPGYQGFLPEIHEKDVRLILADYLAEGVHTGGFSEVEPPYKHHFPSVENYLLAYAQHLRISIPIIAHQLEFGAHSGDIDKITCLNNLLILDKYQRDCNSLRWQDPFFHGHANRQYIQRAFTYWDGRFFLVRVNLEDGHFRDMTYGEYRPERQNKVNGPLPV